jgi:protein-tyrosine phosphatase
MNGSSLCRGVGYDARDSHWTQTAIRLKRHSYPSLPNFRCLGGFRTADGRCTLPGRLFRSGQFADATETDLEQVALLGLRGIVDFRGASERPAAVAQVLPARVHALPIEPLILQQIKDRLASGVVPDVHEIGEMMRATYVDFVEIHAHQYARFFELLLAADGAIAFHCASGKDRTGFAAALVLLALGVRAVDVFDDYLYSNNKVPVPTLAGTFPLAIKQSLSRVHASYLKAALDAATGMYGSLTGFMRDGLSIGPSELQHLRELYLSN